MYLLDADDVGNFLKDNSSFGKNQQLITIDAAQSNQFDVHVIEENVFILKPMLSLIDLRSLQAEIKRKLGEKNIIVGLVGQGITEKHIVTHFIPKGVISESNPVIAYDSKGPVNTNFYKFAKSPFTKFTDLLKAFFLLLRSKPVDKFKVNGLHINAISLGTQSLFDGVSCGMRHVQHMLLMHNWKTDNFKQPNLLVAQDLTQKELSKLFNKTSMNYGEFISLAWQQTFMTGLSLEEKKQRNFLNYFMGWPKEGKTSQKIIYFLSLGFITSPLISLLKTFLQFPIHAIGESMHYLRNKLMLQTPHSLVIQFLRSIGIVFTAAIEGVSNTLGFIINTIMSPIDNFKVSWKNNKALGVLSGLLSLGVLVSVALFVLPLAFSQLANYLPVLSNLSALINTSVFTIAGMNLFTSLGVVIASIGSFFGLLKSGMSSLMSKNPSGGIVESAAEKHGLDKETYDDLSSAMSSLSKLGGEQQNDGVAVFHTFEMPQPERDAPGFISSEKSVDIIEGPENMLDQEENTPGFKP
jgi:hypothetical protein